MKQFTEAQVDDLIKLKWGRLVDSPEHVAYVTNGVLAKIFKVSREKIRQLYMARFEEAKAK